MPSNLGTQTISVKYFDPVNSTIVNDIGLDVRKVGIYSGGYLTKVSDVSVTLSPLTCEIGDGTWQIRAKVAASVTPITISSAAPLIVLRWTYTGDAAADYIDFKNVAVGAQLSTDVIVGLGTYVGSTLQAVFDYTTRTNPDLASLNLKVEPTVAASMAVRIRAGRVSYGSVNYTIADQLSSTFTAPVSGSRIDVIYVDNDGVVKILTGVAASTPAVPDFQQKIALAYITINTGASSIVASSITDVRSDIIAREAVLLTGNQTIAGVKTFSSSLIVPTPTTDYQAATKKYGDDTFVALTGNQTVAGIKTFPSSPIVPTPSTDYQASTKKYVDDKDTANVKLTGDQTVAGVKTLSSSPVIPTPTTDYQASTKKYVDDKDGANVKLTGDQTVAGVKTFTSFPVTPSSAPTTNYQVANKKYADDKIAAMPTGVSASQASLGGNSGINTNGQFYYISIGRDSSGNLKMASGVGNTGDAVPLPSGCAQADSHWMVSIKTVTCNGYDMYAYDIAVDANRIVTVRASSNNWV